VVPENPLPEPLDALGVLLAEVLDRVRDRLRKPERVDPPSHEPALLPQLALEVAPIELLHGASERRRVDARDVDHLALHRPLDRRRERMQRLRRLLAVDGEVRRDGNRLAERDEDAPAEPLARLEAEPDRYDREAPRGVRLVAERDPRGARLDPLHVHVRAGGALGIDGDEPLAFECLVARREHLRVAVQLVRVVRLQVDGNHPQGDEEPRHERIAEERGGGEVVHLPREHRPDEQRVDQVVRMVDAEEYGAHARHPLRMPHLDALEEEPDPEPRDHPDNGVEGVHCTPHPVLVRAARLQHRDHGHFDDVRGGLAIAPGVADRADRRSRPLPPAGLVSS
jgi:hypothetical protein